MSGIPRFNSWLQYLIYADLGNAASGCINLRTDNKWVLTMKQSCLILFGQDLMEHGKEVVGSSTRITDYLSELMISINDILPEKANTKIMERPINQDIIAQGNYGKRK